MMGGKPANIKVSTIIFRGDDIYSGVTDEILFLNKRNKPSHELGALLFRVSLVEGDDVCIG